MKKNILLLGVSGNVTQSIISVLKSIDMDLNLIGACVFEKSVGKYLVDNFYISPYANDKNFINWLINICQNEKIDLVLSGVEENIIAISHNLSTLETNTSAKFIVATPEQLKIGNDKLCTCQWLKDNGLNYPLYADGANEKDIKELLSKISFPVIIKPKNGKGSQNIFIIKSIEELNKVKQIKDYVIEELLGDENSEYTVATYTNQKGVFQNLIILNRHLQNGTTVIAKTVQNKAIFNECKRITEKLKIKGPLNIQLRIHNDKPVCFELNVRFSGTTSIRHLLGYKDLYASIKEYAFNETNILDYFNYKDGTVIRYAQEKIVEEK